MRYAQIDKQTNIILNIIEVENGYNFDGNFDWVNADQYQISIGCTYHDGTFFEGETELQKIPTPLELAQMQLTSQQLYIEQLELQNAEQSIDTDFRLIMLENNLNEERGTL